MSNKNKVGLRVKNLLEIQPKTRNNDWLLVFEYRDMYEGVHIPYKIREKLMDGPSMETITRYRRKIQETNDELKASEHVSNRRRQLQYSMKQKHMPDKPIRGTIENTRIKKENKKINRKKILGLF